METPSSSGIPCITLEDDESAMEYMPAGSIRQDSVMAASPITDEHEGAATKSSGSSIEHSGRTQKIVNRSKLTKMLDKKVPIKKTTQEFDSKNRKNDRLKRLLDKCNRAKLKPNKVANHALLKKEYPSYYNKMIAKIVRSMSIKSQDEWICTVCKRTYKTHKSIAKHLIIDHGWHLEYESDNDAAEIKTELPGEDIKTKNEKDAPIEGRGETSTQTHSFNQLPTEDGKIRLFLTIYRAKSFPSSNLELLRELFRNLNLDSSIFDFLTENQNHFKVYVTNMISANYIKYLVNDVGESIFSIFINQYTQGNEKCLLLLMKYFSNEKNQINIRFYRFIKIQSKNYAKQIIDGLNNDGFNIAKCGGFGLDATNQNEDLLNPITRDLKNVHSRAVINKCIFQSLLLITEKACTYLPQNLVSMIKETYKCFVNSKNKDRYFEPSVIQDIGLKFYDLQWFFESICFILAEWDKLKQDINVMNNFYAKNLLQDDNNLIYLTSIWEILHPILDLHCTFLNENFDPLDIFENLRNVLSLLRQRDIKPERDLQGLENQFAEGKYHFVKFLISELQQLLPEELSEPNTPSSILLQQVTFFSSTNMKRKSQLDVSNIFKIFDLMPTIQLIKKEWNLLLQEDEKLIPIGDSINCWMKIKACADYTNISQFVLQMLCLPFSNFEVKRIFDSVTEFINEIKEELPIEIVEAFLIIRCQNEPNISEICSK